MKLTQEKKAYLRNLTLQKKYLRQRESLHNLPKLLALVTPAPVFHIDEIKENPHPALCVFARQHHYDIVTLLKHLRRDGIFTKEYGTWIIAPQYKHAGLVFYTVGRRDRYACLDMYLTPAGESFMEAFIANHPTKPRVKRNE